MHICFPLRPLLDSIERLGGRYLPGRRVTDILLRDAPSTVNGGGGGGGGGNGGRGRPSASAVTCTVSGGDAGGPVVEEVHEADAVVMAVGVTGLQRIVAGSTALKSFPEFQVRFNHRAL